MRSVVISIAVHAVLGALLVMKVTTRSSVAPDIAAAEPRVTEIELYVEPPIAKPAIAKPAIAKPAIAKPADVVAATRIAASHTLSHPARSAVVEAMPTKAIDLPPTSTVAAPRVVTLPSPHDAVESADLPATKMVENAPPTTAPAQTFRMRVDADGAAHLTDRRNFQLGRDDGPGDAIEAHAEQWLEAHHEQSNVVDMKMPALATVARFDVTDAAMRLAGQDPYAYEKLKVLDATRDERARIGARYRERQLLGTPALVRANLADIARLPTDQRAAAIIALYLDCDNSAAGEVARATIADYVRAQGLAIELPSH